MSASAYPLLFAEWKLRNTLIPNRLVFAPTCPTWVANPVEGFEPVTTFVDITADALAEVAVLLTRKPAPAGR